MQSHDDARLLIDAVEDLQVRVGLQADVLESVVGMSSSSQGYEYDSYKEALKAALKQGKKERKDNKAQKKVRGQTWD